MIENNEASQPTQAPVEAPNAPTQNTSGGNTPQAVDRVEQAKQLVQRMDEFEKRMDEKIARLEELRSDAILGGGSMAGQAELTPEQAQAQKAKAMADEIVKAFRK